MNTDSGKSPLNECIEFIENYKREGLVGDTKFLKQIIVPIFNANSRPLS